MWLAASFGPKVFCKASETQSLPDRPLTLKDLDWRPLLLPPLAGFDPFQPSGADLEKLRALQREPRLECEFDCTMLPGGSFVEHGRPCFGRLGLLVKKQRGLVIGMNVAKPEAYLFVGFLEDLDRLNNSKPPEPFRIKPSLGEIMANLRELLGFVVNTAAGRAVLLGPGIGPTNNIAIVAGPPTNAAIVARIGFPASGVTGNFTSIADAPGLVALMPNGKVAFVASTTAESGVWLGNGDNVEGVALSGRPAPVSLLGAGYTFVLPFVLPGSDNLAVNGRGELAFSTSLNGPGLNSTNSDFVVAGTPAALRVIAQNGQPAPGIPGAFFRRFDGGSSAFSHVLLGADGAVVFVGCYSATGKDFGLWLAPTNGATPLLLMRTGQQAPGAPAGVVFADTLLIFVPSFRQAFMNSRNVVVFRAQVGGPGINQANRFGIWLAEPDGTVSVVARGGDMIDTGDGTLRQLDGNVSFGVDPVFMAGPEDGRRSPFNDRGEVALSASFTNGTGGVFIAQTGINLNAERAGNDIRVRFPTLAGKIYRVDYTTNLPAISWPVLQNSVAGIGGKVTVTDTNAGTLQSRFYRAVRLD